MKKSPLYFTPTRLSRYYSDGRIDFRRSADAFKRECSVSFIVKSSDGLMRRENLRSYIVKLLLTAGLLPRDNAFAVIARLIEISVKHPQKPLMQIITDFAAAHDTEVRRITHMIERNFDIYDPNTVERVGAITGTKPIAAKDALYDLAVYARTSYFCGGRNE